MNQTDEEAIPLLDDPIEKPEQPEQKEGSAPQVSEGNRNPFLPHEHIARLAHEREEFQRQFDEFSKQQGDFARLTLQHADKGDLERLVHICTQKVLTEMMPQLEQRIRTEVIRQMTASSSSGKSS